MAAKHVKTESLKTTADRISEVALELLEREGPDAVTMRRVANAVGITAMAIYHYFPNRDALLQAITDSEFGRLLVCIEGRRQKAPGRGRPKTLLVELMEGYVDYALSRPRVFDYVFSQPRPGARKFPDDFRARRSPTLNPVADALLDGMAKGKLKRDDEWEIALQLWAHAHGYVTLYRAGRFQLTEAAFRGLWRRSAERMIDGLGA